MPPLGTFGDPQGSGYIATWRLRPILCVLGFTQKLTKKIYRALAHTGQRAIIQRGWAKLGMIPNNPLPPNVHVIDSVPHDWLFPLCSGVVHHGARRTPVLAHHLGCLSGTEMPDVLPRPAAMLM